jgi:peptidoglycan LD-endopeptidase LytH
VRARKRGSLKAFLFGAVCGVAGALLGVAIVGWPQGSSRVPHSATSVLDRGGAAVDDAGDGTVRGGDREPAATGTAGHDADVVAPAPSPEPVLDAPPARELAGRALIIPVQGITPDQLTPSFSHERGSRRHEAIDILAPRHTPVLAVEDGTIARLFYSEAGGHTIYQFDPSERFCYYYAHLERYAEDLVEGHPVRQGQVIGYVGVSGNAPADTPHLHFAIFRLSSAKRWWEGTPIDPFPVLGHKVGRE